MGEDGYTEEHSALVVPWRNIAYALLTVTIGSLGTLVIVSTIRGADALSTVALALAILAFIAQLLIYVAQNSAAGAQLAQSRAINLDTLSALAEIRTRSETTHSLVEASSQKLDFLFMGPRGPDHDKQMALRNELSNEPADDDDDIEDLDERWRPATADEDPVIGILRTWPKASETDAPLKALQQLDALSISWLFRYGNDELASRQIRTPPGLPVPSLRRSPVSAGMVNLGLLRRVRQDGRYVACLTDEGVQAARFLTADPPVPAHILKAMGIPRSR